MTNDPVFPPEVFEIIISELADNLDSLRSCALVSRAFYGLARVFSRLQVGPRIDQERSLAKLCELLEGSPSFAAGVRSLCLRDKWEHSHPRWLTEADLGRCLSLLGSLTRLCIAVKSSSWPYRLPWSEISAANRAAIQTILPTLTCLELHNVCELPLTLFSHSSALLSLTINDVIFHDDSDAAVTTATGSRIQLDHLCLEVSVFLINNFLDWITSPESPLDASRLRSLECTVDDLADEFPIQRLLDASAPSLQHLCLNSYSCLFSRSLQWSFVADVQTVSYYDDRELDLKRLAHLHTLSLAIWLDTISSRNYQYLLSLRPLVLPPLQQKLALVFHLQSEDLRPELFQAVATADSALAALQAVASVTFIFWDGITDIPPRTRKEALIDISDEFIEKMPLLAERFSDTGGLHVFRSTRPVR